MKNILKNTIKLLLVGVITLGFTGCLGDTTTEEKSVSTYNLKDGVFTTDKGTYKLKNYELIGYHGYDCIEFSGYSNKDKYCSEDTKKLKSMWFYLLNKAGTPKEDLEYTMTIILDKQGNFIKMGQ